MITGLSGTANISITGGQYQIDGGSWTSSSGTIADTSTVRVRQTSSGSFTTVTDAVLTINGEGTELVYQEGKGWHARQENGSKIEKLTGTNGNGDNNGEYWKITTADGTQYFFGLHSLLWFRRERQEKRRS